MSLRLRLSSICLVTLSCVGALLFAPGLRAEPRVLTTVKPLQFIAEAIVAGEGSVASLITGTDSPHHFSLSPTDRLSIDRADLVLWIDPAFEVNLQDLFTRLAAEQSGLLLTASRLEGMTLRYYEDGSLDPHLWLSQSNALLIAEALARELVAQYPDKAAHYQAALARFRNASDDFVRRTGARVDAQRASAYLVYHDAFSYLEADLGVRHSASLVADPDVVPGMREMLRLRETVNATPPACILLEPETSDALVDTVLRDHSPRRITLDVLGSDMPGGTSAYHQLLERLIDGFATCVN
jgi:zinc transport system substrate-binding protein